MAGIEDRLVKIKAIQAEAEAKKVAEKEKTAKESAEKRTGLEQEKAQIDGELESATEELQKNETGLAEINAMDLSALDTESRAGIEAEIVGIKEEVDNLSGKIAELTKRKQEIDGEMNGGNIEKESFLKPVDLSALGKEHIITVDHTGKERGYEGAPGKLSQSFVEIDGKFYFNHSSGQVNGEHRNVRSNFLKGKDGRIVYAGFESKKGDHAQVFKRLFNEKNGTLERELNEEDGKLKEETIYASSSDGSAVHAKKISYDDRGGITFERDIGQVVPDTSGQPRDALPDPLNIQLSF